MIYKSKRLFYCFLGALFCIMDAFYNGFPLTYSDTSTYIISGFGLDMPMDRPIVYGILLRIFSLNGLSLYLVVFFQSVILSYLIITLVHLLIKSKYSLELGLLLVIILSLLTGLSWTCSQLMADIFTPIALLSLVLIVNYNFKKGESILLYVIYTISIATHLSHIVLFVVILLFTYIIKFFFIQKSHWRLYNLRIAYLFVLTISTIVTMGSAMSKSKHVFFMGAMAEQGILKQYLYDVCGEKKYKLCSYKDSLPEKGWQFVWNEDSPLYKIGGWKEAKPECDEIIHETLTKPKYIYMHIMASLKATGSQLLLFKIGDGNGPFNKGTRLHERVSTYFPSDLYLYENAKQNSSKLDFVSILNTLFTFIIALSVLVIIVLLFNKQIRNNKNLLFIVSLLIGSIFINAWDCGTFANAIDRLGCKMIWLFPLSAFILLINSWKHKEK